MITPCGFSINAPNLLVWETVPVPIPNAWSVSTELCAFGNKVTIAPAGKTKSAGNSNVFVIVVPNSWFEFAFIYLNL